MLTVPHVLTGAALGVALGNPVAGFAAGVISHYPLDAVPHTDPGTWHWDDPFPFKPHTTDMVVGILDLSLAAYGLLYLAGVSPIVAAAPIAGIIGAVLPDVIGIAPLFIHPLAKVPVLARFYAATKRIHRAARPDQWLLGIATQAVVIVGAVWYLLGS